jgi:hypothetical protein
MNFENEYALPGLEYFFLVCHWMGKDPLSYIKGWSVPLQRIGDDEDNEFS